MAAPSLGSSASGPLSSQSSFASFRLHCQEPHIEQQPPLPPSLPDCNIDPIAILIAKITFFVRTRPSCTLILVFIVVEDGVVGGGGAEAAGAIFLRTTSDYPRRCVFGGVCVCGNVRGNTLMTRSRLPRVSLIDTAVVDVRLGLLACDG